MSYGNPFSQMATANKLSINDIQRGIQSGTIDAYIGIPLIQQKVRDAQKMQLVQAVLRQAEGGPPSTVSDQVMQAAGQVTRPEAPLSSTLPATDRQRPAPSMGIEEAQSNLPTEYAGGGIVAFADRGEVEIPGESENKNRLRAAGYTEGRSALRRAVDPEEFELRPWAQEAVDAYTGGIDYLADKFAERPTLPKKYQSSLVRQFAPDEDLGVTPFSPPSVNTSYQSALDLERRPTGGEFSPMPTRATPMMGSTEAANKGAVDYLNAIAPPERGMAPIPGAAPTGREGITLTPGVQPPKASEYGEPTSFAGLESMLKDYTEGSRSRRQKLEEMVLGQQVDRPALERENLANALTEFGGAAMAGRSPWALTNIGEAVLRGNKAYSSGIDQIRERDANIIKQLAALGLKGDELEQQALKYGIDIQQMKVDAPYKQAMTRRALAELPSIAMEPEVKRAQIGQVEAQTGLLGAETELKRTTTELLPIETAIKKINALRKTAQDRPGSIPAKDIRELETVLLPSILEDPLAYGPLAVELQQFPDIVRGLQQEKGSSMYEKARMAAAPLVRRYIDGLKREMYENAPSRRGSDYGYSSSED